MEETKSLGMQEMTLYEIDEVSGAGIAYAVGYAIGWVAGWARVPQDEWAWSGGG